MDILAAISSVESYWKRTVGLTPAAYGIQIADFPLLQEGKDQETMRTEEFIITYGLGKEINEIVSLIGNFFQSCKYDIAIKYEDETGKDILQIKIFSKFTPEETAKKEWDFLGEAVKRIPPEKTRFLSIFADIA
jgi:hypothetical protein